MANVLVILIEANGISILNHIQVVECLIRLDYQSSVFVELALDQLHDPMYCVGGHNLNVFMIFVVEKEILKLYLLFTRNFFDKAWFQIWRKFYKKLLVWKLFIVQGMNLVDLQLPFLNIFDAYFLVNFLLVQIYEKCLDSIFHFNLMSFYGGGQISLFEKNLQVRGEQVVHKKAKHH